MKTLQRENQTPNPPAPEIHPGRGGLSISIFSVLFSLLFCSYGLSFLVPIDGTNMQMVFALLTILYGLLGLVILACAYQYRASWCVTAIMVSAVSYLVIYVLALARGALTGLQLSGFYLLALALWCNWLAVVKLVKAGEAKS